MDVPSRLVAIVPAAAQALSALDESAWREPYSPTATWSRVQLLGHLIDSALNNHHRFVRAMIHDEVRLPGYPQVEMVAVQNYATADPHGLLILWADLNLFLARVLGQVPDRKWATPCFIGDNPVMSLEELADDYVRHLRHHLDQLLGPGVV